MNCRIEKDDKLVDLFSLGNLYVSDFIEKDTDVSVNSRTPLTLCLSKKSGLVQLKDTADFDKMYKRYWYHSGTNQTMTLELHGIVKSILDLTKHKEGSHWIDIGCNDGTLLSAVPSSYKRIGFDPATNNCMKAIDHADEVINDYFCFKPYLERKAKVITSIAMFYDLPDPVAFCNDIYRTLEDDGLWVMQLSYLPLMLDQLAFDNICHEHLEYYSLTSLKYLLDKCNFKIVDCVLNDVNGGSFRVYIQKDVAKKESFATSPYRDVANYRVQSTLNHEKSYNLNDPKTYTDWFNKILDLKKTTLEFIDAELSKGKTVWAYGASTKGNTLLQFFGLDSKRISGIAERQPQKWGLKTAGTDIPIYSEEYVRAQKPDYMLVLPWHFINEFRIRESEYLSSGGKFIIPCPRFEII